MNFKTVNSKIHKIQITTFIAARFQQSVYLSCPLTGKTGAYTTTRFYNQQTRASLRIKIFVRTVN